MVKTRASERAKIEVFDFPSSTVQKFERVLLHKIVIRCPHHLQLQSAPHIHLGGISKQVRYTMYLNGENESEWASKQAKIEVFDFSIVLQFKKFERVLSHKIVIRCPHHLQLQSAPHIYLGGLSKLVRYTHVFEWWKRERVSERVS